MNTYTPEAWLRQRGTIPTSSETLVRDLGMSAGHASMALTRLHRSGTAVRVAARGRFFPALYIHRENIPHEQAQRVRVEVPSPGSADRLPAERPAG